jgi:hypothetical protein
MNDDENDIETFLENLMDDKIDRKLIRMLLEDANCEQILETLLDLVSEERLKR